MSGVHEDAPEPPYRPVDNGRAVEIDDEAWARAESVEYVDGYPIYARRTF